VLDRARAAGLTRILVPGWDRASSEAALDLAATYPDLLDAAVGVHPHHVAAATEADWTAVETLATDRGAIAVGEIGLDFYRNLSPLDAQRDALARLLDLAARVRKPVVVHDREAHDEVTAALVAHAGRVRGVHVAADGPVTGILHAFSGNAGMAAALVEAGYLISFALPVSFPKNIGPRAAAAAIPETHLLVETDSPYLGVSKDERNEPTTVLRTAAVLARLRETDPGQIGAAAAESYSRLLGAPMSTDR
jgi:TatD DNase family protein